MVSFGGRYAVHIKNGLEFGNVISDHTVSIFDISNSDLRLQFMLFLKYKIKPPPVLSLVSDLSLRIWSKPAIANRLSDISLSKNVSHIPIISGPFSHASVICKIAFLAYTKNPRNFVQMFSVGQ